MGKVKIGDGEYRFPVTIDSCDETYTCISDENCKEVSKNDIVLALNELALLRAERDGLKREIQEAVELLELFEPITMVVDNAVQEWLLRNTTPGGEE